MKKLRSIVTILFLSLILAGMTSCEVGLRTDNGRHRRQFRERDNRAKVIIIEKDRGHRSDDRHDD